MSGKTPKDERTVRGGSRAGGHADPAGGGAAPGAGPDAFSDANTARGDESAGGGEGGRADEIERLNAGNVPTEEDAGVGDDALDAAREALAEGGATDGARGWLAGLLALPNDHPKKTIAVALALCLVCSVLVSAAAVILRPAQQANAELDRRKNILEVAGLMDGDAEPTAADIESAFERIERRIVELERGEYAEDIDAEGFDQRAAAADPVLGVGIAPDSDIAGIGRRSRYAEVYLVRDGESLSQVVLPVHGLGLWSTLYGFVALEGDLRTISGLKFYDHAETPGLGGEIENVAWRRKWEGKLAFDESGEVVVDVVKGTVPANAPNAAYSVDGLAGATLTSQGVKNLLRYWLDEDGFGPFLERLGEQEGVARAGGATGGEAGRGRRARAGSGAAPLAPSRSSS